MHTEYVIPTEILEAIYSEGSVHRKRELLLDDTIRCFCKKGRTVDSTNTPTYQNSYGGCCAIGRTLTDLELYAIADASYGTKSLNELMEEDIQLPTLFHLEKILGRTFLNSIQDLHDGPEYWLNEEGPTKLSSMGQRYVNSIRNKQCNPDFVV